MRSATAISTSTLRSAEAARTAARSARTRARGSSRLDVERENLLAAHAFCGATRGGGGQGPAAGQSRCSSYWFSRGQLPTRQARRRPRRFRAPGRAGRDRQRCVRCSPPATSARSRRVRGGDRLPRGEPGDRTRAGRPQAGGDDAGVAGLRRTGPRASRPRAPLRRGGARARREDGDPQKLGSALNAVAQMRARRRGPRPRRAAVRRGRRAGPAVRGQRARRGRASQSRDGVHRARRAQRGARSALQEIVAIAGETGSVPVGQARSTSPRGSRPARATRNARCATSAPPKRTRATRASCATPRTTRSCSRSSSLRGRHPKRRPPSAQDGRPPTRSCLPRSAPGWTRRGSAPTGRRAAARASRRLHSLGQTNGS